MGDPCHAYFLLTPLSEFFGCLGPTEVVTGPLSTEGAIGQTPEFPKWFAATEKAGKGNSCKKKEMRKRTKGGNSTQKENGHKT